MKRRRNSTGRRVSFMPPASTRSLVTAGALVALFLSLLAADRRASAAPPKTDLTVSAAISLKDVLDEISHAYSTPNPDVSIHFNLGASGTLQRQIEQGAPVDIFISASPAQMDALASQKLIVPETRKDLVKNSVVLIVPKDRAGPADFQALAGASVKQIAIGDPQSVPAGKYAQEVLTHFGLFDQLRLQRKFVFAKDVRQVLTYVETGNVDAGIVYATDARTSSRVSVAATAPEDSHSPVIYPVAVLAASKQQQAAKNLIDFLLSSASAPIFQKYGFIPIAK